MLNLSHDWVPVYQTGVRIPNGDKIIDYMAPLDAHCSAAQAAPKYLKSCTVNYR